jgi:hypothetical protein
MARPARRRRRSPRRRASSRRAGSPRWRRPRPRQQAVGEREEGVGGDDRALGQRLGQPSAFAASAGLAARRCARSRRGSSGRRRCRRWRRPWHRRWCSTSRAWRRGRRSAGRQLGSVGARFVTTFRSMSSTTALSRVLQQEAAGDRASPSGRRARVGQAAGEQQAQVLLGGDDGDRLLVASGAMITSVKISTISLRRLASSVRLSATMPPKAETGSQAAPCS